ncbi:TIR domain-containing protein [Rhizobium leguminosarum bv. viciae]|uniref:toll/interleukin-1 receptor domain-containing protein n=1 Tax=Rhizobium leguminosarum TaxID=384 RepID=UPI0014421F2A|nr:toll/interleukin-1 receptor domain-containing protein [Rhizobium leguminosarum]NKK99609.1 TIR domain-containing protein [Rhizobium leguminosarum bv. viciae]
MMRYVFISHANLDKPLLKPILEALLREGIPLWVDRPRETGLGDHPLLQPGIRSGADWDAEIRSGYERAVCVLFFLSCNSNNLARSDSLFREFDHGSHNDKLVIAKLDDIGRGEISGLMRIRQAVDVSGFRTEGPPALGGLVAELRRLLLHEGGASAQPSQTNQKRFGRLLPFDCDRRLQRRRFREAVEAELERDLVRPQMFFVVGEESQCADKLVEQFQAVDLPYLLQRRGLSAPVDDRLLRWPADVSSRADTDEIKDHLDDLEYELAEKLGISARSGITGIEHRLKHQNGALFLYFDVSVRKWNDGHHRLLVEWIDWWRRLNTTGRHYPIVVVGRFCHGGERIWPFGIGSPTARVLNYLMGLAKLAGDLVTIAILPQLGPVSYEDVEAWIDEHSAFAAEAPPDLRIRLRKYFTGALGMGERKVPMVQAASFLRTIIDEMKISADTSSSRSAVL